MENEDTYKHLVTLFKMFKNRPYHLAKYLIENSALTNDFIKNVKNNNKLKELSSDQKALPPAIYFTDISQMEDFYNSFINDVKNMSNIEEITKEVNKKLDELIKLERYEEAANIRDYMKRNNIKRIF
jgi:hypothetical protein